MLVQGGRLETRAEGCMSARGEVGEGCSISVQAARSA